MNLNGYYKSSWLLLSVDLKVCYVNVPVPRFLQFDVLFISHLDQVKGNFILGIVHSCKCRKIAVCFTTLGNTTKS